MHRLPPYLKAAKEAIHEFDPNHSDLIGTIGTILIAISMGDLAAFLGIILVVFSIWDKILSVRNKMGFAFIYNALKKFKKKKRKPPIE